VKPRDITVLAFNNISPFHLSVPCLVFDYHSQEGLPSCNLQICAVDPDNGGMLQTSAGFAVQTSLTLEDAMLADVLIVPSWRDPQERPPAAIVASVQAVYERGATAAGLDCCLHLVCQWHEADVANRIARRLVVAPHRQGGQAQYIEQPLHNAPGGDRLSDLLYRLTADPVGPYPLDSLARHVAMSRRNFTRRFRQLTGTTVGRWLIEQRLAYAQRMLESSNLTVEEVARLSGFGSALSLRQHFARAYHTSPSVYRALFADVGARHDAKR